MTVCCVFYQLRCKTKSSFIHYPTPLLHWLKTNQTAVLCCVTNWPPTEAPCFYWRPSFNYLAAGSDQVSIGGNTVFPILSLNCMKIFSFALLCCAVYCTTSQFEILCLFIEKFFWILEWKIVKRLMSNWPIVSRCDFIHWTLSHILPMATSAHYGLLMNNICAQRK